MAGPTESLRLELVEPDGSVIDLGQVTAEVDPNRGPSGMVAGVGVWPFDMAVDEVRRRCAILRDVFKTGGSSTWRVTPAGLEPFVAAFNLETFSSAGRSFELMLEREADQTKAVAWPATDQGFGDYTPPPSVVEAPASAEELVARELLARLEVQPLPIKAGDLLVARVKAETPEEFANVAGSLRALATALNVRVVAVEPAAELEVVPAELLAALVDAVLVRTGGLILPVDRRARMIAEAAGDLGLLISKPGRPS